MSPRLRFYAYNLGIPLLLALLVFCLFDLTDIDRVISNALLDPSTGEFILRHSDLFETLTHKWPRVIPDWTGELAIIGALLSFVWPRLVAHQQTASVGFLERARLAPLLRFTTQHRRDLFFLIVAFALTTGVIHYLKAHTSVYCPVETTLYGGHELRKEWFENFTWLQKAGDGRCWPGGHASSGFTMVALYFIARRYRWQHAKALLTAVLVLGMVFGTTRVLQGWHYMSHTFWAGIFVWLSTLLVALLFYGRTLLDTEPEPSVARPQALIGAVRIS
ncbi:membrane-associated PAP2 superfamily phosphatase [Pseudomonas sp. TE3786]